MADTILTIQQVENFFWNMTIQMLGLDPTATANQDRVRIGWPEYGAPSWQVNDNKIFLLVTQDDNASMTQQIETTYATQDVNNVDGQYNSTRVHRVAWVCYGPSSYSDAATIRTSLTWETYKELMDASNLYRVPSPAVPVRSPELFNGMWWERATYICQFNEHVIQHNTIPSINTIGPATIITN